MNEGEIRSKKEYNENPQKHIINYGKKESGLGIVALILSITGCFTIIGLILAIIDLAKKDDTKNHVCSKIAVFVSIISITIGIIFTASKNTNTSGSKPTISKQEISSQEIPSEEIYSEATDTDLTEKEPSITMGQNNALSTAATYLSYTSFSYSGLIDQLEFEKYSTEDATYAADNCGADWNEQAAKKAQEYLDYSSFSKSGLMDQLEFDGFTSEQAEYGATAVGY